MNHELEVQDFTLEEVEKVYRPYFIDPGRKSVFTATIGLDITQHQVRRCSIKEYYHLTGSTVYSSKLRKKKDEGGITEIESRIPTSKSLDIDNFLEHVRYMLTYIQILFKFYRFHTAKPRFNLYQGRQRAPEYMVNMLLDGTPKYNKKKRRKKSRNKQRKKKKNGIVKNKGKQKASLAVSNNNNNR